MAWRLDRCGTLRPTDRDFHAAGGAFRHADARGLFTAWRSSYYHGVSSRSLRHLPPADRDLHAAGGALRHADARGLFTAWRSSYYNGVSSRSLRRLRRPTAISTQQAASFGTQTPAAGFAPPTRHTRSPIFSPHATYRRLISSYKFLLSPSLFPVAAPIGPPLRAVGHRPAGIGAVCSSFLSAPRRRDSNGLFFHLQVLPVLAAPPAPLQASAPVALPRPPLGGRSPTTSAAQSPESRLCGGVRIHSPPSFPHRPCPKSIVLRSASL